MVSPHLLRRLQQAALTPSSHWVEVQAEDVVEATSHFLTDGDMLQLGESCQRALPSRRGPRDKPSKRIWIGVARLLRLIRLLEGTESV